MDEIQNYDCPRCGYNTCHKHNLLSHLKRKNSCRCTFSNISITDILSTLNKQKSDKKHSCLHCSKIFSTSSNKLRHQNNCKNNLVINLQSQVDNLTKKIEKLSFNNKNNIENNQSLEILKLRTDLEFYKNRKNEAFYQSILEKYLGKSHKSIEVGITDVTTDICHAEIKEWKNYKEAVGQLIIYNSCDKKEKLEMYMFGKYSQKEKAFKAISSCNIHLYEFLHTEDKVDIINFKTKEVVYTYRPCN